MGAAGGATSLPLSVFQLNATPSTSCCDHAGQCAKSGVVQACCGGSAAGRSLWAQSGRLAEASGAGSLVPHLDPLGSTWIHLAHLPLAAALVACLPRCEVLAPPCSAGWCASRAGRRAGHRPAGALVWSAAPGGRDGGGCLGAWAWVFVWGGAWMVGASALSRLSSVHPPRSCPITTSTNLHVPGALAPCPNTRSVRWTQGSRHTATPPSSHFAAMQPGTHTRPTNPCRPAAVPPPRRARERVPPARPWCLHIPVAPWLARPPLWPLCAALDHRRALLAHSNHSGIYSAELLPAGRGLRAHCPLRLCVWAAVRAVHSGGCVGNKRPATAPFPLATLAILPCALLLHTLPFSSSHQHHHHQHTLHPPTHPFNRGERRAHPRHGHIPGRGEGPARRRRRARAAGAL